VCIKPVCHSAGFRKHRFSKCEAIPSREFQSRISCLTHLACRRLQDLLPSQARAAVLHTQRVTPNSFPWRHLLKDERELGDRPAPVVAGNAPVRRFFGSSRLSLPVEVGGRENRLIAAVGGGSNSTNTADGKREFNRTLGVVLRPWRGLPMDPDSSVPDSTRVRKRRSCSWIPSSESNARSDPWPMLGSASAGSDVRKPRKADRLCPNWKIWTRLANGYLLLALPP
jgi:hypothetical protein